MSSYTINIIMLFNISIFSISCGGISCLNNGLFNSNILADETFQYLWKIDVGHFERWNSLIYLYASHLVIMDRCHIRSLTRLNIYFKIHRYVTHGFHENCRFWPVSPTHNLRICSFQWKLMVFMIFSHEIHTKVAIMRFRPLGLSASSIWGQGFDNYIRRAGSKIRNVSKSLHNVALRYVLDANVYL